MKADKYEKLLKKSRKILTSNIYTDFNYAWGKYRMISPAQGHFVGIWNWDSAFHAIGMIPYDIETAKEQIVGFLQFQRDNGMLPDAIFESGEIAAACSKPPLMAYAAMRIYDECRDREFIEKVYPALSMELHFWENERQYDGMFHYDAYRGENCSDEEYLTCVRFESGWDNSPRWDYEPQNIWPVDLNCYIVMAYRAVAAMAYEQEKDGSEWERKADVLAEKINFRLWNDNLMSYTDYNFKGDRYSEVLTPASFMPLYAGIAENEKAQAMADTAKKHFMPGMPTVAYTSSEYDDRYEHAYWRGPCWLNVAYFAAKGLKNYGFEEIADQIKETILTWVYNDKDCIHENYNATTGEGLCSDHFSWSSVFVREFIENF